nr:pyruvate kinase 1, cytosolic-like [Arachis hypogaea]
MGYTLIDYGLTHFDEVLREADGIIQSRGNLGIDLPPEKVFLFRKSALYKCNMAGKPAVLTRVVDSMTDNLRPTRAEATDVANAVLDGSDAILLGVETLRGLYPIETISTFGRICSERLKEINSWRWGSRSIFGVQFLCTVVFFLISQGNQVYVSSLL